MQNNNLIILSLLGLGCIFGMIIASGYYNTKMNKKEFINQTDTIYNNIIFDSINYNILIKDSIIVRLKQNCKYETDKAINASDSNAVIQFTELAGAN